MLSLISVRLLLGTSPPPSTAGVLAEGSAQHAQGSCQTGSTERLSCTAVCFFPNLSCFRQFGALLTAPFLMLFPHPGPCTGLYRLPRASPWDPSNPKPFASWDHRSSAPRTELISSRVLWGVCGAAERDGLLGQGEVSCLKAPTPALCPPRAWHPPPRAIAAGAAASAPRKLRVLLDVTAGNPTPTPQRDEGASRLGARGLAVLLGPAPSRRCRPHAPFGGRAAPCSPSRHTAPGPNCGN